MSENAEAKARRYPARAGSRFSASTPSRFSPAVSVTRATPTTCAGTKASGAGRATAPPSGHVVRTYSPSPASSGSRRDDRAAVDPVPVGSDYARTPERQELPADRAGSCRHRFPGLEATRRGGRENARPVRARRLAGLRPLSREDAREAHERGPAARREQLSAALTEARPGRPRLDV